MRTPSTRLGHKKSRNGCRRCKERHVKCDEQRPCRNCVRFNIPCSLVQSAERASIPSPSGSSNRGPESPRAGPSGTSNHPPPSTARSPVESGDIGLAHDSATWLQSLRLLHHYNTVVSMELSDEPRTNVVWTRTVPELAFANEFLMHGLLALSALHYAQCHPEERTNYLLVSTHYQNLAVQEFTTRLVSVKDENLEPLFFLSSFIFIISMCYIADPQDPQSLVSFSEVAHSFMLQQGIKSILDTKPIDEWTRSGPLSSLIVEPTVSTMKQTGPFQDRMEKLYAVARKVAPSIDAINMQSCSILAIESLRTTHSICAAAGPQERNKRIWFWPASLTPLFIEMISQGHPVALVILAHYAALVRPFEHPHWMNRGWSQKIMTSVEHALDGEWTTWIEWPRKSLNENIDVDEMEDRTPVGSN